MKLTRPWGTYRVLNKGNGFKVKLIEVSPHKKLSLQRHKHRSEHWVVIEGKAKITNGHNVYSLENSESAFIPKNGIHRLENCKETPLRIVEVQSGSYLEEDDIERLGDDYGRQRK